MNDVVTCSEHQIWELEDVLRAAANEVAHDTEQSVNNSEDYAELFRRGRRPLYSEVQRYSPGDEVNRIMGLAQMSAQQMWAEEARYSHRSEEHTSELQPL